MGKKNKNKTAGGVGVSKNDDTVGAKNQDGNTTNTSTMSNTTKVADTIADAPGFSLLINAVRVALLALAGYVAYDIRLYAIRDYGLVIHEFDPWFNYRATEYLKEHGLEAFFHWYDYMSWYPLGRPVGSTIYPGMQISGVLIHHVLNNIVGIPMSLNDVCCYIPAWFGVSATFLTGLLTFECSGSLDAGVVASLIMSCIPAHTMRSVGGGYDNESIAVTAMVLTFYLWNRALRSKTSAIFFGALSGFAYVYMVAAWGGYVFVLNLVGLHAILLIFLGRYSTKVFIAYFLFFTIGTAGAIQIPVVGLTPLKSMEQIGPLGVYGIYCVFFMCDQIIRMGYVPKSELKSLRIKALGAAAVVGLLFAFVILPDGYFGPLSSRVRGLLVQHTRTGNPLVDSVAEHQPASPRAYFQYLFYACYWAPIGYVSSFLAITDRSLFLITYATVAYFFSSKMVRLIILLGPIASCLSGVAVAIMLRWSVSQFLSMESNTPVEDPKDPSFKDHPLGPEMGLTIYQMKKVYHESNMLRKTTAGLILYWIIFGSVNFFQYGHHMAKAMSNPSIMYFAQTNSGERVLVDDYREAYFWLNENTAADARVMAWWDYGYQITGIGNRTSIADGNTWNHEHIATLGRCLVSEPEQAHEMIRHLADYVLVWTGGGGDDVAKMPHIARIANSVYKSVCGIDDPLCNKLSMDSQRRPSEFMASTLIYKLHSAGQAAGVNVDPNLFENVFTSKYNKVRIWKVQNIDEESKAWNADPANRICDPPGSWICKGQYPPKFQHFIAEKKDFRQLEDFNIKGHDDEAAEYQKKYHESMMQKGKGH